MAKLSKPKVSSSSTEGRVIAAAAYIRASTEQQKFSLEHQLATIKDYAERQGFEIVRIYEDAGRSGLRFEGMEAMKRLIDDVSNGDAPFSAILVYDVDRWGRYPDAEEGIYYAHICSRAGIPIHYCAERFANDDSTSSQLLKSVRRVMAGDFSRNLSAKVFAAHSHGSEAGYRQGGAPGFGLRRMLVDENHKPKGELLAGQRKSLKADHVILVPGPPTETNTVRSIYKMFVEDGKSEKEIADLLNMVGVVADISRPWTAGAIRRILINENYIGNNVYNRVSFKLKQKRIQNKPDIWVRAEGAFEPIVDRAIFERARAVIDARSQQLTDEELLTLLRNALQSEGHLSGFVIDEMDAMPSTRVYRKRFGSLPRAYAMIGYDPKRDYRYIEANRSLRKRHPEVVALLIEEMIQAGALVHHDPLTELLRVNEEFSISIILARATRTKAGSLRWKVRLDTGLLPDITILMRMDETNENVLDYYLLPSIDLTQSKLNLAERNTFSLETYRFDSLDFFFSLVERAVFEDVA